MSRFQTDTAVTRTGDGRYEATMDTGWWIINGPNGGYVAAIVARAIDAEVALGAPADAPKSLHSLTLHYLRPPAEGPVRVEVTVERRGRSVATATARVHQDDQLLVVAVAAVAAPRATHEFNELVAPHAPDPESLPAPRRPEGAPTIPMNERYEMRPCLGSATAEWGPETEPMPAVSGGWLRFAEPTPIDAIALCALTDAWFPPVFHRMPAQPMAVPTVDLTVHVRQVPADPTDWVLVRFASPLAVAGVPHRGRRDLGPPRQPAGGQPAAGDPGLTGQPLPTSGSGAVAIGGMPSPCESTSR